MSRDPEYLPFWLYVIAITAILVAFLVTIATAGAVRDVAKLLF